MLRRPPRRNLLTHSFPTRRSSGLEGLDGGPQLVEAGDVLADGSEADPLGGEELVQHGGEQERVGAGSDRHVPGGLLGGLGASGVDHDDLPAARSEEHTSELQSLMRTSYAVFCWKKKTKQIM